MNYGETFCTIAFEAIRKEEAELRALNSANPQARPMSVSMIGETTIAYVIARHALADSRYPRVFGEMDYEKSGDRVDICFVDKSNSPIASFELKLADLSENKWRQTIHNDIKKHLDPLRKIKNACSTCERYNAVFAITEDDQSKEVIEALVRRIAATNLTDMKFATSDLIQLNLTNHERAHFWRYGRIIVFTGSYLAEPMNVQGF